MPTLECLDERTKRILDGLDAMRQDFSERFDHFDAAFNLRLRTVETDLAAVKKDVIEIKLAASEQKGQKGVVIAVGGAIMLMLGSIGNMVMMRLLGPDGIFGKIMPH